MPKKIDYLPHTCLEPLSQHEVIVTHTGQNEGQDSVYIDTVSRTFEQHLRFQITGTATKLEIDGTTLSSASRM